MRLRQFSKKRLLILTITTIVLLLCGIALGYVLLTRTSENTSDQSRFKVASSEGDNTSPVPQDEVSTQTPATVLPASILNLTNWKIALPINTPHAGTPDEIEQPELATFTDSNSFFVNEKRDGVTFRAHANGATTKNSKYPRSELREMKMGGMKEAAWSTDQGAHTMTVRQAITHLPTVKSEVVAAQIHDESDDVVMIRLEDSHLFVESNGKNIGSLDDNYALGAIYEAKIEVRDNVIRVFYNGVLKVQVNKNGDEYYFKAGCYTQTNSTKGDGADSYAEVVIYQLNVSHS